jgi:hypothetical protein
MLRAAPLFCLLLIIVSACASDERGTSYQRLVAAAERGDRPIDWQALRFAYAETADFDPLFGRAQRAARNKKMLEALAARDLVGAAEEAQRRLDQVFVDIDAHYVCYLAYRELGDAAREKTHHDAVIGLVRSIQTGDGQTPASAYTVISVAEEYSVLFVLGLKPTHQSLFVDKETGHAYDKLDIVEPDGTPHTLFFLIDRVLAAESTALKKQGPRMPPGPANHDP